MSTVAISDLRFDTDKDIVASSTNMQRKSSAGGYKSADVKTRLRIRTVPRKCNPTPIPLGNMLISGASDLLSRMSKHNEKETRMKSIEVDSPFGNITEAKLIQLTEIPDLKRVTLLQISIDSTKQAVEVIGELLPSLQRLQLQQSNLSSFRDLGTSLRSLRVLWATHCHISNLDGISALTNLQEVYLQHNNVRDISPLMMHDEIRAIDLEGNQITEIGQIEQLAFCPQLRSLKLTGNYSIETVKQYRQVVANILPQLVTFDDKAFSDSEKHRLPDLEIDAVIQIQAVKSAREAVKNMEVVPPCEIQSLRTVPYFSNSGYSLNSSCVNDSGSRLTHGTDIVFAGNVSSALRRHRHKAETGDLHGTPIHTKQLLFYK